MIRYTDEAIAKIKKEDKFDLIKNIQNNHHKLQKDQSEPVSEVLEHDFSIDFLLYNPDIEQGESNGKVTLKSKSNDKLTEELIKEIKIIHINQLAYIVEQNGVQTLVLKDEVNKFDMFELQKQLTNMNVKPNKILGQTNNMLEYRELIDPNIVMLKQQKPNSNVHLLILMSSTIMATAWLNKKLKRKELLRRYLKRKRLLKSMDIDDSDDEELNRIQKKMKMKQYEKDFINLPHGIKINQIKSFINNTLDKSPIPHEITKNIKDKVENGVYDKNMEESLSPLSALSDILLKEFNGHKYIEQLFLSLSKKPEELNLTLKP